MRAAEDRVPPHTWETGPGEAELELTWMPPSRGFALRASEAFLLSVLFKFIEVFACGLFGFVEYFDCLQLFLKICVLSLVLAVPFGDISIGLVVFKRHVLSQSPMRFVF